MAGTEITWRTLRGDRIGVTIHAPDTTDPTIVRQVIGKNLTLNIPLPEARQIGEALIAACDAGTWPQPVPRKTIPIHQAPPAGLYADPDQL